MIIYLVKSTLLLGLLIGIYKLLFENEKMHRFNRFFLLFALSFGLTAPLISFEIYPEQSIAGVEMQQMERVVNAPSEAVSNSVEPLIIPGREAVPKAETTLDTSKGTGWSISALDILIGLYVLITYLLLIRFAGGLLEIRNKVKAGSHEKAGSATLVLLDEPVSPQSIFKYIFLEKESFENGEIEPEILDHELTHVRRLHSLDVLFIEFLKVILWFNPFIYLYKHAIQLNHEFIADEFVVSKISSASDYQNMLLRLTASNIPMSITSSINFSLTKKRIRMMFRSYSPLRSCSKSLLLLPVLALLVLTFCIKKSDYADPNSDRLYHVPELHVDFNRSEELGIPRALAARFTASGELFTGTQKIYYTENDSLYMEYYFKDGIEKTVIHYEEDGDINRLEKGRYLNEPIIKEIYNNGNLAYENVPPTESEDGMGHVRLWHNNGQLSVEHSYTGDQVKQGLMTEYDEDGNITRQKRYEDGELVEMIK